MRSWLARVVWLAISAAAFAGCEGDGGDCTAGTPGCACADTEVPCIEGTFCVAGTCREPSCTQGEEGCACYGNFTCDRGEDGRWMVCQDGLCRASSCPQGGLGCGCYSDGSCDVGLLCDDSDGVARCQMPGCAVGDLDCGCRADRTCNTGDDGVRLTCVDGVCRQPTCEQGTVGCACNPDFSCDRGASCVDGLCEVIACTPGTISCSCRSDGTCDGSLSCSSGRCVDSSCTEGTEGCGCLVGDRCGAADPGELLTCRSGRCVAESCPEGTNGCACTAGGGCVSTGSRCVAGVCESSTCAPGTLNCACGPGATCEDGAYCGTGNRCVDGRGLPGFACRADATCDPGSRCEAGSCTPCRVGAQGCGCFDSGSCNRGLACIDGLCVSEVGAARPVPVDPQCYTPCESDLVSASGVVRCSAEGLMRYCREGTTCRDGSCLPPGASVPSCTSDVECPDFQACIRGRCYSECTDDSECSLGTHCHRHVCRLPCTTDGRASCPAGSYCSSVDGENGFCLPVRNPDSVEPRSTVPGGVVLDVTTAELSNIATSARFRLTNVSERALAVTITKVEHTAYGSGAPVVESSTPMPWLSLGVLADDVPGTPIVAPSRVPSVTVTVDVGETVVVVARDAATASITRWQGELEVQVADAGTQRISLAYNQRPDGQWAGTMYYFANFGDRRLAEWMAARDSAAALGNVGNALVRVWGDLRTRSGGVTFSQMKAAMLATIRGDLLRLGERLDPATTCDVAICYPFTTPSGGVALGRYTDSSDRPVPSGVTQFPIAFNLQASATPGVLTGRIESAQSLQYPGNPALTLEFVGDPQACSAALNGGDCATYLRRLDAVVQLGGRYAVDSSSDCDEHGTGFQHVTVPWIVPGFDDGTEADPASGLRYRHECRDAIVPFGTVSAERNVGYALANPVADGRSPTRRIELVDGALFNQSEMIILFRERFEGSLLGEPMDRRFAAYGVMILERNPAELDASSFTAGATAARPAPTGLLGVECSPDVLEPILGPGVELDGTNVSGVARALLNGDRPGSGAPTVADPQTVHYLCGDAGVFDGGPSLTEPAVCPAGSSVRYFLSTLDRAAIAGHPCNADGTCDSTLERWIDLGLNDVRLDPIWRCTGSAVYCDANRRDLRDGKTFYASGPTEPLFVPLVAEIEGAFRYRTRFRTRDGRTVGFTPSLCPEGITTVPYCYDAAAIEAARDRVDCGITLFTRFYGSLDADARTQLRTYLTRNFAYDTVPGPDLPVSNEGFERLYSQLLIMLGDDAYTAAFASRFDLAGSQLVSFEGSAFEPGGIDLSGGAGYEMYTLYRATQYYDLVLQRFFDLGAALWTAFQAGNASPINFVTQGTITTYFDRVVRASVQKSRAWSEIAERYVSFNRPDLARRVVERAYSAAYLESIILSQMMTAAADAVELSERAQIRVALEDAQRLYRVALLEMRDVYGAINDGTTLFGFPPDYIPFPALDPGDVNAFDRTLRRARTLASIAAEAEEVALSSSRSYETDAAAFQSELVQIRNTYENQLAEICGTFTGRDGRVYPAIPIYAALEDRARTMRNPCGLMGTGALHDALAGLELADLDMRSVEASYESLFEEIEIERARVSQQCELTFSIAEFEYQQGGRTENLQTAIDASQLSLSSLRRLRTTLVQTTNLAKCSLGLSTDCPQAAAALAVFTAANLGLDAAETAGEAGISRMQAEIRRIQRETARWRTERACDSALIDSEARTATLLLRLKQLDIDALRQQYRVALAAADIEELRNQATRLLAEREESEALRIDVEAARNDPNVRIYRNDAVLNADRTFQAAVREAYRATRVFEYYTSSSYARLDTLFLVRLVRRGDYSLERYLDELDAAYDRFRETYGTPDTRVAIVSLRDDVLRIPRVGPDDVALSERERVRLLREALADPGYLDERGYRTFRFDTTLSTLSPLTRNHKVLYVEAEVIGSRIGDTVGRVYLRQAGTGLVRPLDRADLYYRFPERTAVINPFFNGVRSFGPEIYRNERLRDRPFVNSYWELVLNQSDEVVNQDIDLGSITDVRLYVYYTDFTSF